MSIDLTKLDPKARAAFVERIAKANLAYFCSEYLVGPTEEPFNGQILFGPHQLLWSEMIAKYKKIINIAYRGSGKCTPAGSLITAATGERIPVEQWNGGHLMSLNLETYKLEPKWSPPSVENGYAQCTKIRTQTGREHTATSNEPLLTPAGWRQIGALKPGDFIAMPRRLPIGPAGKLDEPWLLAMAVGDGSLTLGALDISNQDPGIIAALHEVAKRKDWNLQDRGKGLWGFSAGWRPDNTPRGYLRSYDLDHKGSYEKRIPEGVFTACREDQIEFLSGYLDSDVYIDVERPSVEFYSVAKELMVGLRHLLLRFGIASCLSQKNGMYKGERHLSWRLLVTDTINVQRLAALAKCRGENRHKLQTILGLPSTIGVGGGRRQGFIPREWLTSRGLKCVYKVLNPDKAERLYPNNPEVQAMLSGDIVWDEILVVEDAGVLFTYSVTVPEFENYVINDIITHNSYYHSTLLPIWKAWKQSDQRILLFSSEEKRAKETLQDVKNLLEKSPKMHHLIPDRGKKGAKWSELSIRLTNNTEIIAVGWGQATRGRHPALIVVDDVLTDRVLYFSTERERSLEYFLGTVSGMAVPKTQIVCVGTIFHRQDMWASLLANSQYAHTVIPAVRYPEDPLPVIVPPGERESIDKILVQRPPRTAEAVDVPGAAPVGSPIAGMVPMWPEVHPIEFLLGKLLEVKEIIFTREFLCVPVSSLSSLFPLELTMHESQLLGEAAFGMPLDWWQQTYRINRVFGGIDLAISAKIGRDYTVIIILGLDANGNRYVLDIHRSRGMAFDDQLQLAKRIAEKYQVDKLACESNAFQAVFAQKLKDLTDLPIKEFYTGKSKHSLHTGIPSLRILHENRKYRFPIGNAQSKELVERLSFELAGFSIHDGKVVSSVDHDDVAMALYICESNIEDSKFQFSFVGHQDMKHIKQLNPEQIDSQIWKTQNKAPSKDWFGGTLPKAPEAQGGVDLTGPEAPKPTSDPQMQRAIRNMLGFDPWNKG